MAYESPAQVLSLYLIKTIISNRKNLKDICKMSKMSTFLVGHFASPIPVALSKNREILHTPAPSWPHKMFGTRPKFCQVFFMTFLYIILAGYNNCQESCEMKLQICFHTMSVLVFSFCFVAPKLGCELIWNVIYYGWTNHQLEDPIRSSKFQGADIN